MSLKDNRRCPFMIVCLLALGAISLASFSFSRNAAAGSAPGVLKCVSIGSTRPAVTLSGQVPGDYEIFDLKVKRGNEEYSLKSPGAVDQNMDSEERNKLEEEGVVSSARVVALVEDFRRGVFTLVLRTPGQYDLRLYALPATIRSRITPNSKKASFEALLLEGEVPDAKPLRMRCSFDHSI